MDEEAKQGTTISALYQQIENELLQLTNCLDAIPNDRDHINTAKQVIKQLESDFAELPKLLLASSKASLRLSSSAAQSPVESGLAKSQKMVDLKERFRNLKEDFTQLREPEEEERPSCCSLS
jgi:hypothetical protein